MKKVDWMRFTADEIILAISSTPRIMGSWESDTSNIEEGFTVEFHRAECTPWLDSECLYNLEVIGEFEVNGTRWYKGKNSDASFSSARAAMAAEDRWLAKRIAKDASDDSVIPLAKQWKFTESDVVEVLYGEPFNFEEDDEIARDTDNRN